MKSLCVFLGSNPGADEKYRLATTSVGRELARLGVRCVYGGSNTGLMKVLADSVLEAGGTVVGVTVQALKDKEIFHSGLTELHVVQTMHERKAMMEEFADGFIALPGGIGTLEEFFEVYTLNHLSFHEKPCGLLNIDNYYGPLEQMLDNAYREGFMTTPHREKVVVADNPETMVALMLERIDSTCR